jgi:hypothetical protein
MEMVGHRVKEAGHDERHEHHLHADRDAMKVPRSIGARSLPRNPCHHA